MAKELFPKDDQKAEAQDDGTSMVYYPSLLIGLGGTGTQALLRVKRLLQEQFPEGYHLHRFLFIDTDARSFSKQPGLPDVEPKEQCPIGFGDVESLLHDPDLYPQIWERFPKNRLQQKYIRLLATGNGASQIRSLGALALALDYRNVVNRIKEAHDDLIEMRNRITVQTQQKGAVVATSVTPYLVGSLAGGTGSGCFMDVAVIAKSICGGVKGRLSGFFALPGAFDLKFPDPDMIRNVRANTYAALKELQFALDNETEERKKLGNIRYVYEGEKVGYELDANDRLFSLCHLIDDRNETGKISTMEDLYTLMARSIFQEVGTSFGGSKSAWESNVSVLNSASKCKKTQKDRILGTVSTAALVFPAERIAEYCSFRRTAAVLQECLLGTSLTVDQIRSKVSTLLTQLECDERGSSSQLVDTLLHDGEVIKSPADFGITKSFGKNKSAAEFVTVIREKWSQFLAEDLPNVDVMVEANRKKFLDVDSGVPGENLFRELMAFSISTASDAGVRASRDVLAELARVALEMKGQAEKRTSEWHEQRESCIQEFNGLCDKLQHIGMFAKVVTKKDEELKAKLIARTADFIQQSLWASARKAALEVMSQLTARIQDVKGKWDNLNVQLKGLLDQSNISAIKLESQKRDRLVTNLSFELDITKPGYEKQFYHELVKDRKAIDDYAVVVAAYGKGDLFYSALLEAQGIGSLGNVIGVPIYRNISPGLFNTNIVDFIEQHPEELSIGAGDEGITRFLEIAKEVCKPFWDARPVGGIDFKEYWALSLKPLDSKGGPARYPEVIEKWAKPYKFDFVAHEAPYEIILGQRTYGARAFYLRQCEEWKTIYLSQKTEFDKSFMLESHEAFESIPDLFPPSEDIPLKYFALGTSMGFIVKRGDWYYLALEQTKDPSGQGIIRVLYRSEKKDWETVHTLADAPALPERIGILDFSRMKAQVDKDKHCLAQGRAKAVGALGAIPAAIELIGKAIDIYHSERGTALLKQQLTAYCNFVLDPIAKADDIFSKEKAAIEEYVITIGQ